jgi:hypothetical protein
VPGATSPASDDSIGSSLAIFSGGVRIEPGTVKLAPLVTIVVAACNSSGGATQNPTGSGSSTTKPPNNGFSASLSAEMNDGSGAKPAGSGAAVAGSGSGTAMAGSGTAGSGAAMAGSGAAGSGAAGSGAAMAGSAAKPAAGSAAPVVIAPPPPPIGHVPVSGPQRPSEHRAHVNPPPELAAIKIDLEPNWDRDYDQAGTISFVLKIPNTNDTRVFVFRYGYDLDHAPSDREAYKKFLADQKVMKVTLDRQRGAAWYLEGTDPSGAAVFRNIVVYGGKRLECGGSLYKDPAATALGPDLRDKVVAAAKKICETMTL